MSKSDESHAPLTTLERVQAILEVVRWLRDPPGLPERNKELWQKALAKARRKVRSEELPFAEGTRGSGDSPKGTRRPPKKATEGAAEHVAEVIYGELDPAYAEAVKRWPMKRRSVSGRPPILAAACGR
jgi:hypothetical protein